MPCQYLSDEVINYFSDYSYRAFFRETAIFNVISSMCRASKWSLTARLEHNHGLEIWFARSTYPIDLPSITNHPAPLSCDRHCQPQSPKPCLHASMRFVSRVKLFDTSSVLTLSSMSSRSLSLPSYAMLCSRQYPKIMDVKEYRAVVGRERQEKRAGGVQGDRAIVTGQLRRVHLDLLAEAFKVDDKNLAGVQGLALSVIDPQFARYNLIDLVSLTLSPGFEDVKRIEENLMASYPTAFTVDSHIAFICSKNKPLSNA